MFGRILLYLALHILILFLKATSDFVDCGWEKKDIIPKDSCDYILIATGATVPHQGKFPFKKHPCILI